MNNPQLPDFFRNSNTSRAIRVVLMRAVLFGFVFFAACPLSLHCQNVPPSNAILVRPRSYVGDEITSSDAFKKVLGKPPTDKSELSKDQDGVENAVKNAPEGGTERNQAMREEKHFAADSFNGEFGPWFKMDALPATSRLLQNAFDDTWTIGHEAKRVHLRARPDGTTNTSSYPSVHAMEATVLCGILKMLQPDRAAELDKHCEEIGYHRLILRKHFPSDLVAGHRVGKCILKQMIQSPAFKVDFANALQELRPYLK